MRQLDTVGLGWRPELSALIFSHLGEIDLVEVILDDYLHASRNRLSALRTLSSQVPVFFHGVGLGLASAIPVCEKRLAAVARFLEVMQPKVWSEHLSFVRAGGIEIGHLAAPPRTEATIEGTLKNLQRVRTVTGSVPLLENVATLLEPPGSTLSEQEWVGGIVQPSGAGLLLDLHNLYANSVNFGFEPFRYLERFPLEQVKMIHLSGGHWLKGGRLLDDHIHKVPEIVFSLLEAATRRFPHSVQVVIERDGNYPPFRELLDEIRKARAALARGRARQSMREERNERASV